MIFRRNRQSKMEEIYKKGTAEGLFQGYLQARKELETRLEGLTSRIEKQDIKLQEMESTSKLAKDQINLLGRLFSELDKRQAYMTIETRDVVRKINEILETENL